MAHPPQEQAPVRTGTSKTASSSLNIQAMTAARTRARRLTQKHCCKSSRRAMEKIQCRKNYCSAWAKKSPKKGTAIRSPSNRPPSPPRAGFLLSGPPTLRAFCISGDHMRFGSVCSGIEAASVAWLELGWRAAWLAEIDKFASAVLAPPLPPGSEPGGHDQDRARHPDRRVAPVRGGERHAGVGLESHRLGAHHDRQGEKPLHHR